jgi:hypothetical protein
MAGRFTSGRCKLGNESATETVRKKDNYYSYENVCRTSEISLIIMLSRLDPLPMHREGVPQPYAAFPLVLHGLQNLAFSL